MLTIIAVTVVVLIAALLGVAATKPNAFRVQRAATIKASPERIFPFINDFHTWNSWSPWEKIDPAMQRTYSGVASGAGAIYEWEGTNKVGKGRMEITSTVPPSKVIIKLDFLKPMEGHNTAEFTLEPHGDSTNVTWAMYGPSQFASKVFQVFVSMDKMIGKSFEIGLANLKALAEK
jgi:uncharacterized protein YndB with AHSA1/START domain